MFSISGRPDHVNSAKWEILTAAEHFSQIRAARPSANAMGVGTDKVTIFVRVPYRVVGLVVGPRGSTVKRIQQITRTFIVTPSRDKEPCFEVRGTPENVERARKEIESYIVFRTGNKATIDEEVYDGFYNSTNLLSQQCHLGGGSTSSYQLPDRQRSPSSNNSNCLGVSDSGLELPDTSRENGIDVSHGMDGGCPQWSLPVPKVFSGMRFTPPDTSYHPMPAPFLTSEKVSPPAPSSGGNDNKSQPLSPTGSYESTSSDGGVHVNSPKQSPLQKRVAPPCCICMSEEDTAALIPCGHNMFCQACAHYIACSSGVCPLCSAQVINVMHM